MFESMTQPLWEGMESSFNISLNLGLLTPHLIKYEEVLSKVYEYCLAHSDNGVQMHDQDWMEFVDEWDISSHDEEIAKSNVKVQSTKSPKKMSDKCKDLPKNESPKNMGHSISIQAQDLISSKNEIKLNSNAKILVNQGMMTQQLSEIEHQLRSQALLFNHSADSKLVWFKKLCLREAGYHVALLEQVLNAFIFCSQNKKSLLDGFPLLFLRHQHLAEEHLCRFKSIDALLQSGGSWEDLNLSHSLVKFEGKDKHHESLDLGTLWARYPNRYENDSTMSERLKWLIDNPKPLIGRQKNKLKFDINNQKKVLQSLLQTICNFKNKSLNEHELKSDLFIDINEIVLESAHNSCKNSESFLQQIEKNLLNHLACIRTVHAGLTYREKVLAERVCRDVIMHVNHLSWSLNLFNELNEPRYAGLHVQNIIWNMQFFFEQYYELLCIHEGFGIVEEHDLETYVNILSETFKSISSKPMTKLMNDLNIKMATSYIYYVKSGLDQKKTNPKALELLLQGYKFSSDYKLSGEKSYCSSELTFKQFKEEVQDFINQFLKCATELNKEVFDWNSRQSGAAFS